jgi:hypothetical protein
VRHRTERVAEVLHGCYLEYDYSLLGNVWESADL